MKRRALVILAAALGLGASVALAPQMAAGAESSYVGDIVPPQVGPLGESSAIQFNLALDKKKKGKLVPTYVKRFGSRAVPLRCTDGTTTYAGEGEHGDVKFWDHFRSARVKKRKFSAAGPGEFYEATSEVTGQIPRSGSATGTLRISYTYPYSGTTCDSGVLNWTAAPGPLLDEPGKDRDPP